MQRIGDYEVLGEIARGGMGVIYTVRGPGGRELALKLTRDAGDKVRRRFEREAHALARLRHRHLLPIHAAGEHMGHPYLVMDLVRGGSLQDRLDTGGAFPPEDAAALISKVARGLAHAHEAGVLHRDLKPANVLLTEEGEPLLTDFGLAKDMDLERSRLTQTGAALGTPGFWSPEQATGDKQAFGPASDVYGLGATLYALLTREPPFSGPSLTANIVSTARDRVVPPSKVNPDVDAALERIVLRCLSKAPTDRYEGAAALADALDRWSAGDGGGRRWVAPLVGAAAALALLGGGLLFLGPPRPQVPGPAEIDVAPLVSETRPPSDQPTSRVEAPSEASELAEEGRKLLLRGELRPALELVDRALALEPDHPKATPYKASILINLGREDDAFAMLGAHLSRRQNVHARLIYGELLRKRGRYEEAVAEFDVMVTAQPEEAVGYWQRAVTLQALGEFSKALEDFDRALELAPTQSIVLNSRGILHASQARYRLAVADFRASLEHLTPSDEGQRGVTAHNLKNALEDQKKTQPEFERYGREGSEAVARGDLAAAQRAFDACIRIQPDAPVAYYNRATVRAQLGEHAEAIADFDRALSLEPDYVSAWNNRGMACFLVGRFDEAVRSFSEVLRLKPGMGTVHYQRAVARLRTRHAVDEVKADLRAALELLAADDPTRARARDLLGLLEPLAPGSQGIPRGLGRSGG